MLCCSANCCAIYLGSGILFLLFVYTLLSTQPFFITGIDNVEHAKSSALGALIFFVVLFTISLGLILRRRTKERSRGGGDDMDGYSYSRLNVNLDYQMSAGSSSDAQY
eukprot:CAMPEP_0183704032 /NCGR_PEP_ID=MMETSP0737-20130205/1521_1 /TAXON_ID=385413 /ORGANISM="Thalassiosira miniscula, Strain CCMP1093" /LENGTH=107 /DNA_ID=CAMNT_0025930843 /DNA_START=108 /DNA_END=431 /DNA_ORIENTATION=-